LIAFPLPLQLYAHLRDPLHHFFGFLMLKAFSDADNFFCTKASIAGLSDQWPCSGWYQEG
jgi:hypothetical protein